MKSAKGPAICSTRHRFKRLLSRSFGQGIAVPVDGSFRCRSREFAMQYAAALAKDDLEVNNTNPVYFADGICLMENPRANRRCIHCTSLGATFVV